MREKNPTAAYGQSGRKTPVRSHAGNFAHAGFTLLEMLVVMALLGLVAGIALPNFNRLLDSFSFAAQWGKLVDEIDGLPFRAYSQGSSILLDATSARQVLKELPDDWALRIESGSIASQPVIRYRDNGWCDGGQIVISTADGRTRTLELVSPRCGVRAS